MSPCTAASLLTIPPGEVRVISRLPRAVWVALSFTVTCSTRMFEVARSKLRVTPAGLLSGMAALSPVWVEVAEVRAARFTQLAARFTAAVASMRPAPKSWLKGMPAPFVTQPVEPGGCFALRMRISRTSRQPRAGFRSKISATMPAAVGVAEDVPPKSLV